MMPEISTYITSILTPQLISFGTSAVFIETVCSTVSLQMQSAIFHWNDLSFRKALLLIASEEGPFYEPNGKTDIKCFVVLTLRNSPFETLQSAAYHVSGLAKPLSDAQIKAVTSNAIRYFNRLSFETLSKAAQSQPSASDFYGDIIKRYPVSWNALIYLGTTTAKRVIFPKAAVASPFPLSEIEDNAEESGKICKSVLDGYAGELDAPLCQQLNTVTSDDNSIGALVVDCFKMLSRNPDKILRIMEYLLTRGCAFVTSNYFIENGYAERRLKPLRAASSKNGFEEMIQHFSLIDGLGKKHSHTLYQLKN